MKSDILNANHAKDKMNYGSVNPMFCKHWITTAKKIIAIKI